MRTRLIVFPWLLASLGFASSGVPPTFAAQTYSDAGQIAALRALIIDLDQKLRVLERRQEWRDEEDAVAAKASPKITLNDKGFTLASADGANSIRLRGLVQLDARAFFGDNGVGRDAFVLRRARLSSQGVTCLNA